MGIFHRFMLIGVCLWKLDQGSSCHSVHADPI